MPGNQRFNVRVRERKLAPLQRDSLTTDERRVDNGHTTNRSSPACNDRNYGAMARSAGGSDGLRVPRPFCRGQGDALVEAHGSQCEGRYRHASRVQRQDGDGRRRLVHRHRLVEQGGRGEAGRQLVAEARKALGTKAVEQVKVAGGEWVFPGTVDFRPKSKVVPGPDGFPPRSVAPGSVGDARYSPLVTSGNGVVVNASQIANSTGRGDNLVALDTKSRRATLKVLTGFTKGLSVFYLRTDASVDVVSALEGSNLAKNLNAAPGIGSNAGTSARSAIIPIVNGPRGKANPQRQGLQSAVFGEGSPLNRNAMSTTSRRWRARGGKAMPRAPELSPRGAERTTGAGKTGPCRFMRGKLPVG